MQRQQEHREGRSRTVLAAQNRGLQEGWGSPMCFCQRPQKSEHLFLYTQHLDYREGSAPYFPPADCSLKLIPHGVLPSPSSQPVPRVLMYLQHTAKRKIWQHARTISLHPSVAVPSTPSRRHNVSLESAILP